MDWKSFVPSRSQWRETLGSYAGALGCLAIGVVVQTITPAEYRSVATPWVHLAILVSAMFWGAAPASLCAIAGFVWTLVIWVRPPPGDLIGVAAARFIPFAALAVFATWMSHRLKRTSEKLSRELLEQERHKREFEAIANTATTLMWVVDERNEKRWFNRRWYEFTGLAPDGNVWEQSVHPEDYERCRQLFDASFMAHTALRTEFRLRDAAGDYHTFVSATGPYYVDNGDGTQHFVGFVGACEDVSLRREAERAMEALINDKHQFVAVMSHELRTPLTGIMGYADMMLEGIPSPLCEEHAEWTASIKELSERLRRLIEGVLDFANVQRGATEFSATGVEVVPMLRAIVDEFRASARKRGISVNMEHTFAPERMVSDPARIREILEHLLKNAITFTKQGGSVSLAAFEDLDCLVVIVKDTGAGIAAEDMPLIFEPFYQVRANFAREVGGMGIGLAQCRTLAEALGGGIDAKSEGAGKGATFRLRLPLTMPAPVVQHHAESA